MTDRLREAVAAYLEDRTEEGFVALAEAYAMTEPAPHRFQLPSPCAHTPGIPTPNFPNANRACLKCGRLLNQGVPPV